MAGGSEGSERLRAGPGAAVPSARRARVKATALPAGRGRSLVNCRQMINLELREELGPAQLQEKMLRTDGKHPA